MATVTENDSRMAGADVESDEFGYCTEFLLRIPEDPSNCGKKPFLEKRFTSTLLAHGNSIVVVRDEDIVKVHVHTLIPGYLLNYAQQFGEFVKIKVENMSEQHTELVNNGKDPAKKEKKEYGIIAVASGKGLEDLFKEYRADYIVTGGQTMNPSTDDFVKAIQQVNAKKIFILPNNSNIIMAAEQACDIVEGVEVKVIPTKTIPQGLTACMMFNPEDDFSANVEEMTSSIDGVKSGQVTFAIKDTSFDGVEVKKDEFIGISNKTIICSNPNKIETTIKTIESMIDDYSSIVTIIVGEDVSEEETNKLIEILESKYPDIEFDVKIGNQPVYSFIIGVE